MQFKLSLLLASLATLAQSQNAFYSVLIGDIQSHSLEYISYIGQGHIPPAGVLGLYQQLSTYTDDSYTTLFNAIDYNAVSTYVTALPWYSSRLQSELSAGGAAVAAETAAPVAPAV